MLTKEEWRRRKRRAKLTRLAIIAGLLLVVLILAFWGIGKLIRSVFYTEGVFSKTTQGKEISESLLTVNPNSRPGFEMKEVKGIVLHYMANPEVSATEEYSHFEKLQYRLDLKDEDKESVHFIVGLEGEILQCIPTTEISYASANRNKDTISIECSHPELNGAFTKETYESLVDLVATLCKEYELEVDEGVIRHYDVVQDKRKNCPKYFVENEGAWNAFKSDVKAKLAET